MPPAGSQTSTPAYQASPPAPTYLTPEEEQLLAQQEMELAAQEQYAAAPPPQQGYATQPTGGNDQVSPVPESQGYGTAYYVSDPSLPPAGSAPAQPPPSPSGYTGGPPSTYYGGQLEATPSNAIDNTQTIYPAMSAPSGDGYNGYESAVTMPASTKDGTNWSALGGSPDIYPAGIASTNSLARPALSPLPITPFPLSSGRAVPTGPLMGGERAAVAGRPEYTARPPREGRSIAPAPDPSTIPPSGSGLTIGPAPEPTVTGLPGFSANYSASVAPPQFMPGTISAKPPGWDSPRPPGMGPRGVLMGGEVSTIAGRPEYQASPPGTPGTGEGIAAPFNPAIANAANHLIPSTAWDRAIGPDGTPLGNKSVGDPTLDWMKFFPEHVDRGTVEDVERQMAERRKNLPIGEPTPGFQHGVGDAVASGLGTAMQWLGERTSGPGREQNIKTVEQAIANTNLQGLGPTYNEAGVISFRPGPPAPPKTGSVRAFPEAPLSLPTPDPSMLLPGTGYEPSPPPIAGFDPGALLNQAKDSLTGLFNSTTAPAATPTGIAQPSSADTPTRTRVAALPEGASEIVGDNGATYIVNAAGEFIGMRDIDGSPVIFPEGITPEAAKAKEDEIANRVRARLGVADSVTPVTSADAALTEVFEGGTAPAATDTSGTQQPSSVDSGSYSTSSGGTRRSRGTSSTRDYDDEDFDDLTIDDFLDDFDGDGTIGRKDRMKAQAMLNAARKRRASKRTRTRKSNVPQFPESPIRTQVLDNLDEALPGGVPARRKQAS